MGWRLSSWLFLVRLFQLLGSFIPGAMNGWLLYYIYTNNLGLSNTMVILETLVAIIFVYTSLSLLVGHTHHRSKRTAWVVCSICFDVVLCFIDVAIVSLLAFTGVPSNCGGLTIAISKKGDNLKLPSHGYTTIQFSNQQDGHHGELDKYCGMEQGFYFVAIAMILSYIITIVLSVLRICNMSLYSKGEVEHLLEERENMIRLELKIQDQESPSQSPTIPRSRSRTGSIDRDVTTTSGTLLQQAHAGPARPDPGWLIIPVPSATHVGIPSITTIPRIPGAGFILSSTEMHANLAMITDGSRYSPGQQADHTSNNNNNQLPPYSPGNHRRMNGHGDESNDIRLSEYVKGATRAQDMKDEGGF
ncbi:hypothetical protein VMCG_05688 [Cytospora schulzeri]|uniref:Uncharacterized protein n=1 Tax=Cytospora schulzeri TaxID=448051 RepID=A0A423WI82_9PEZI|nr:hypothetical protein VMCG_05688 [Valsa malicola]